MSFRRRRVALSVMLSMVSLTAACGSNSSTNNDAAEDRRDLASQVANGIASGRTSTSTSAADTRKPTGSTPSSSPATTAAPVATTIVDATSTDAEAVHGLGDAARTRQAPVAGFGETTVLAWAANNFRFSEANTPIITGDGIYAVLADGQIIAMEPATGKLRWTVTPSTADKAIGDPVVYQDRLYYLSAASTIIGLDTASGKQKFTFQLDHGGSLTEPIIADGKLFIGNSSSGGGKITIVDLVAVTARSIPVGFDLASSSAVAVGGGKLFVSSAPAAVGDPQQLAAFDLATGSQLWTARTTAAGGFQKNLLYADGLVFSGPTRPASELPGSLAAFDATTGAVVWEGMQLANGRTISPVDDAIAYNNGHLVVTVTGGVAVVDPKTGRQVWSAGLDQFDQFQSISSAAPDFVLGANGTIYTLLRSRSGEEFLLAGLDVATGKVNTQIHTGITALDASGHGELTLIESPARIIAGGGTLVAWFEDARVIGGFVDPGHSPNT